jgi:hypothetical protein
MKVYFQGFDTMYEIWIYHSQNQVDFGLKDPAFPLKDFM